MRANCPHVSAVQRFLDNIEKIVAFDSDMYVSHICNTRSLKNKLIKANYLKNKKSANHKIHVVERGYNIYSIFPFARMKQYGYHSGGAFQSAIEKLDFSFFEANIKNQYLFKYNNPIFELPLVLRSFPNESISENFHNLMALNERYFQDGIFMHVDDKLTLASRVYELALYFYHRNHEECAA